MTSSRVVLLGVIGLGLLCCTKDEPSTKLSRLSTPRPFRHVVLLVVDTLRADIQATAHTPFADGIAGRAPQVSRAWASGTWTAPSIISLFTGAPIRAHGWDLPAGHIGQYPRLPQLKTLAEVLSAHGFQTSAFVTNPYLTRKLEFDRGFETYVRTSDVAMHKALTRHLKRTIDPTKQQFLYLHLMGPHSPLQPSSQARARHQLREEWFQGPRGLQIGAAKRNQQPGVRDAYRRAYTAVVEDTDARIGDLLATLKTLGPDTLIVMTSDHGELLGEQNIVGHGRHLWEPLTHVPLVVSDTQGLPQQMGIDAIPDLVTGLLNIDASWPTTVEGSGLLISQRQGALALSPDPQTKWVWNQAGAHHYDLASDPGERTPLSMDRSATSTRSRWQGRVPLAPPLPLEVTLDEATTQELKAIGYAD